MSKVLKIEVELSAISTFRYRLKGAKKLFYALFLCGHYFIQNGFIRVCIFYLFFWRTVFFSFKVFFLFSACSEFNIIFMNFGNICIIIIYIIGVKYPVFLFSLITFQLHNLWKQNTSCLQGGLKIPFIKKNEEHYQQFFGENLRSISFILNLWY